MKKFDRLSGLWQTNNSETDLYEEWSDPVNNVMYGKSWVMNGSDSIINERVQLKKDGNDFYYIPTVANQNNNNPIPFKLTSSTDSSFVFENRQHDFPQRITYRFINKDSLVARVEGLVKGELRFEDYYYRRVK